MRQETGWEVRGPSGEGAELFEPGEKDPRASFNWTDASLGKVLRDLGEAFHCKPLYSGPNSIRFAPEPNARSRPPIATARDRVTIAVLGVDQAHSLDLSGPKPQPKQSALVHLAFRPLDGDPGQIYGLDRLQGVDNLGKPVRWDRTELLRPSPPTEGRPDEWAVDATLKGLAPQARSLTRLEGELVLFRDTQQVRVEVPVQSPAPVTRTAGAIELTVSEIRQPAPNSLQIRAEVTWPVELELSTSSHNNPGWPYPAVRLASGRLNRMGGSANAGLSGGRRRVMLSCAFEGNVGDPPAAIVWDFVSRSGGDRRVPFQLANIPLPPPLPAGAAPQPGHPPSAPVVPGPELDRSGHLSSTVVIGEQPAGEGELAVGLSLKKADGTWDAVRWKVIDTDEAGAAVLDDVAPGTYRVLRKFRPQAADPKAPAPAKWLNDSVIIRVEAGKTVALPPLKGVRGE